MPKFSAEDADNFAVGNGMGRRGKTRWEDLAIFGGEPAFTEPLHVGRPTLPNRADFDAVVDDIWSRNVLSNNGPLVQELEARFVEMTGARHAIAVANATLGLQLVARALELEGEVILPAFTFIATAHAFRWEGLRLEFCDVEPETHGLDPARVAEAITEETVAIAPVHLWGNDAGSPHLDSLAKENGLHLIFDAAHSLGCPAPAVMGDAQIFSLHATKIVNGFEGGVVATDSDLLCHRLRSMRNFGFAGYDDVRSLGINAKMSEISAAMALCGLKGIEGTLLQNRENHRLYQEVLADLKGLRMRGPIVPETSNCQYVVLEVQESEFGIDRDALLATLWAEGIRARRYFYPGCHWSEPYRWESPNLPERLPVTERLCREVLVLPTGPSIGVEEIEAIGAILRVAQGASRRLAEANLVQAA